jgi:hypothetical protein
MVDQIDFDRINVRRLLTTIERDMANLLALDLFDFSREQILEHANTYLDHMKSLASVEGGAQISEPREATWEDFYPYMPERLLAIEAVEKYGATIILADLWINLTKPVSYLKLTLSGSGLTATTSEDLIGTVDSDSVK